jgi:hypothetical protein
MQTIKPVPGEYLRVDEIAARFGVSVEDVLAACSVVGFAGAHGPDSLIELGLFTHAILSTGIAVRPPQPTNRLRLPVYALTSMVAALALLVAVLGPWRDNATSPSAGGRAAAAYRAQLKSTYDATVKGRPTAAEYRDLARHLSEITPPAGFQAEHAKLIEEAQNVATLAGASPECTDVPSVYTGEGPPDTNCLGESLQSAYETTSAANALEDHVGDVSGTPTP